MAYSAVMDDDLARLRAIMRRYRRFDAVRAERDAEIAALVEADVARGRIGDVVGLTREQVRRIAKAERERRSQLPDAQSAP